MPCREYDIRPPCSPYQMNDRNGLSLKDKAFTPLYQDGPLFLCDVRDYIFHGAEDLISRARGWRILLHVYSLLPSSWESESKQYHTSYNGFVDEFIVRRNASCGKPDIREVPNPLDISWKHQPDYSPEDESTVTNESKWSRLFGDGELRDIIWKDTERTYREVPFFVTNERVLARLLYLFGKLNESMEYIQGMNEILAPLLYVFASEENPSVCEEST